MDSSQIDSCKDMCPAISFLYDQGYTIKWTNYTVNEKKYWGLAVIKPNAYGDPQQVEGVIKETHCEAIQTVLKDLGYEEDSCRLKHTCVMEGDSIEDNARFNKCLVFEWGWKE